jgi:hypothetical protein
MQSITPDSCRLCNITKRNIRVWHINRYASLLAGSYGWTFATWANVDGCFSATNIRIGKEQAKRLLFAVRDARQQCENR